MHDAPEVLSPSGLAVSLLKWNSMKRCIRVINGLCSIFLNYVSYCDLRLGTDEYSFKISVRFIHWTGHLKGIG